MKQSEHFLEKSENRAQLADQAADEPPTMHGGSECAVPWPQRRRPKPDRGAA